MRTAIYGAGSLGTVMGAYLTKNGVDIDLINRNKAHVAALKEKGAHVTGTVDMTVPVSALLPDTLPEPYATLKGNLAIARVPAVRFPALLAPRFDLAVAASAAPVPPLAMGTGVAMPEWNKR